MFPLIIGILLMLLGSFGLDFARRRRSNRRSVAKGGGLGTQAAILRPQFANGLVLLVSVLFIVAGLATAFV